MSNLGPVARAPGASSPFAGLVSPGFLKPVSLFNVVRQASVVGIAAVGVTLVMITGGVDLSVGAVIVFGSVLAASLMDGEDANIPMACGVVLLMGVAVGSSTAPSSHAGGCPRSS